MTDLELSQAINAFMASRKFVMRRELRDEFKTSDQRLKKLHAAGLIKLPPVMTHSIAATYGRKVRGLYPYRKAA